MYAEFLFQILRLVAEECSTEIKVKRGRVFSEVVRTSGADSFGAVVLASCVFVVTS